MPSGLSASTSSALVSDGTTVTRFTPGEQPDGTFSVPVVNGTAVSPAAPKAATKVQEQQPIANGNGNSNGRTNGNGHATPPAPPPDQLHPLMPWALLLFSQTKQVIDVYAMACEYASNAHGNTVRTDDVRAIMTTAFINLSKQGGANVA